MEAEESHARVRVKICGMTDPLEAAAIAALGVDALGFIFVKESPRAADPEIARKIIAALPPFVDAVGVFMNEDPDHVNDMVRYCRLTHVQLHGSEPPEYCQTIDARILKVFRVGPGAPAPAFSQYAGLVDGVLIDTYRKGVAGGTGETFDWEMVDSQELPAPLILAGGLGPENVEAAIRTVRPHAVDLNSGVETAPGRKDIAKVRQVMAAVGGLSSLTP